jgi:hypothetical protein
MGKGAKADSMKAEQTEGLLALEEGFSTKLGTTSKCCCCKLSVGVQVIAVLIILSALNYFMTFVSRTGAPCFFCTLPSHHLARASLCCARRVVAPRLAGNLLRERWRGEIDEQAG